MALDKSDKTSMTWLYDPNSAKPKNEDYLLGKTIDKDFERLGTEGQINAVEYDCTPESIFSSRAEHQVDLQRKLQEDPLVSLRKKEVDSRKKILDNPLKMRQLEYHIDKMKKRKKNKREKNKKKKTRKRRSSRSSEDIEEDDDTLNRKLLEKLKGSLVEESRQSTSITEFKKHGSERQRRRQRSRSPRRRRGESPEHPRHAKKLTKRSEEETQRKLQEMACNASWMDENRSKKLKKYKEEDEQERLRADEISHDSNFLHRELSRASKSGTVEKRIHSNRHNIQRGAATMDKNFARR